MTSARLEQRMQTRVSCQISVTALQRLQLCYSLIRGQLFRKHDWDLASDGRLQIRGQMHEGKSGSATMGRLTDICTSSADVAPSNQVLGGRSATLEVILRICCTFTVIVCIAKSAGKDRARWGRCRTKTACGVVLLVVSAAAAAAVPSVVLLGPVSAASCAVRPSASAIGSGALPDPCPSLCSPEAC